MRKYCCSNCKAKAYQKRKGIPKNRDRTCPTCGKDFMDTSRSNRMIHCNVKCRWKASSKKHKKYKNEYAMKYNKGYYEKNKEELIKKQKVYIARAKDTSRHKKMMCDAQKRDKLKYPEKHSARRIMHRHKKQHPEFYPQECCICGITENVEYHHPDYSFPLSVYPMCIKHHKELHKNEVVFS